jgi:CHC2-type zinc finger protein
MCPLQNSTRSISSGEAFFHNRGIRNDTKTITKVIMPKRKSIRYEDGWQDAWAHEESWEILRRANATDLAVVLKQFGIQVDEYNKKAHCPFPFHQNDRTASFFYYKNTNSFHCFGCKSDGGSVEFLSLMNGISREEAANKIIERFEIDPNTIITERSEDFQQRHNLILEFSTLIRTFILHNINDAIAIEHAEKVCLIFDTINNKHNLDNDGIKSLMSKLKIKLAQYKC